MRISRQFITSLAIFALAFEANAQNYGKYIRLKCDDIPGCVELLLRYAVTLAFPLGVIFIIWSGFLFVAYSSNESKLSEAKKNLTWTIIGLAVLVAAWTLAIAFKKFFQGL